MTNKSKAKGTAFETDIVEYLRSEGVKATRIALAGNLDRGDVVALAANGIDHFIIEAKNVREMNLAEWVRQSQVEAENYAKSTDLLYDPFPLVVHKRRMKGVKDAYVTMSLESMVHLMNLISTQGRP